MKKRSISKLIRWMVIIGLAFFIFMTAMRLVFFFRFKAPGITFTDNLQAFLLGAAYDLRIVCGAILFPFLTGSLILKSNAHKRLSVGSILSIIMTLAVMVFLLIFMKKGHAGMATIMVVASVFVLILLWLRGTKNCNPFEHITSRKIFKAWFHTVALALVVLYAFDFEHYDYLGQRLSASIVNFAGDAKISMSMIWETYPVIPLLIFIIISCLLLILIINKSYKVIEKSEESKSSITKFFYGLVFTLLLALGIFGRFGQYPLRWSDAFSLKDDFKANLALNPVQSFFSTLEYRSSGYDETLVKKYYPLMADYLGVNNPDNKNLNFSRFVQPKDSIQRNVVIVICESFSAYKSTMFGNGLNTTPYFNDLCNDGLFFDRCFTPSYGTARGIWAVITGIPDVEYPNTSSRNPSYVDQHSIINDFAGYSKYYFIGGSSSWANIRGLLTNNLNGLHLLEEEDFNAKKIDVWGISDKRLLLAANDTFATQKKPFVAIVQTADNHRPYTIPDEDRNNFDLVSYPKDTLHKYGFSDNDELNAFRYTDFAFRAFMEAAKKEAYFKNTIFVFVGDHGIKGNASAEFPEVWNSANLTSHHVPLLFYAPGIITPQRNSTICSQVDVLPTAASLAGIPYNNTTMGIDLTSESGRMLSFPAGAFLFDPTIKQIGMVTDSLVFTDNLLSGQQELYKTYSQASDSDTLRLQLKDLSDAWYQTAKYLLYHNKKKEAISH